MYKFSHTFLASCKNRYIEDNYALVFEKKHNTSTVFHCLSRDLAKKKNVLRLKK